VADFADLDFLYGSFEKEEHLREKKCRFFIS
jgi:hypothetical protein